MADEAKPRAVSGEIMTGPLDSAVGGLRPAGDVIDAEYISLPSEPLRAGSRSFENLKSPEPALPIP